MMLPIRQMVHAAWRFGGIQVFILTCVALVGLWHYQRTIGKEHPTLLYIDDADGDYSRWSGRYRLPRAVWRSLQRRGERLTGSPNDFQFRFWGGYLGSHRDCLIATGPEGLGVARVDAPNSKHGGYFRCVLFLTHRQALWAAVVISLIGGALAMTAIWSLTLLGRMVRKRPSRGHCATCGYNLYGLPANRCPECGTSFSPPEANGDGRAAHRNGVGARFAE